ncbi:MAG TPA: DUF1800 family protein, partial [Pyrinomonadaceae bacterium]|nr:DUF1800 family protein [Pyrinomonadaceae bacterium]
MMRSMFGRQLDRESGFVRRMTALALAYALVGATLAAAPPAARAQAARGSARPGEDQRIVHVLNRLGFGARPGDVERVRKIGLERYVEQQLMPEKIEDAAAEAKLGGLQSYRMTTAELFRKYPQPGQLMRALQRQGRLPADLAAAAGNRKGGETAAATKQGAGERMDAEGAMPNDAAAAAMTAGGDEPEAAAGNDARRNYRQAIQQYYMENNLLQPARITAELQASRILRAVYSERQLQEVLVDFWTNHFNVYANKGADRWLLVSYDRDTIRPHTLGKFRDLLLATAQSPAMLFYLDNFQSVSPTAGQGANRMRPRVKRFFETLTNPQMNGADEAGQGAAPPRRARRMNRRRELRREEVSNAQSAQMPAPGQQQAQETPNAPQQPRRMRRGINENYARELMELHTLGVEGGYTQRDVQEVARCFTGWTIFDPRGLGGMAGLTNAERAGTFFFNARLHDDGEKLVLGHKIPAGGGIND